MTHQMTRITTSVLTAATCVGLTAGTAAAVSSGPASAAHAAYDTSAARGRLVSAVHLRTMSAERVRTWLATDDFDATAVRYGVDTYRLVYQTVDPHGRPTVASGLVVLPRGGARQLQTVSYAHGTEVYKPDAPSTAPDVWGPGPAVTYAAAGFAAVAPDYLGLGRGPGAPPWKDVPSETTASLDLLRAARQFVPRTGRTLRHEVLVTGFSQGASAALGLARALQQGADPWFEVKAVAPISGAYDMAGAEIPALLGGRVNPKAGVVYTAYLLTAWNRLHGLYDSPTEVFQEPYASRVDTLFDGTTPGQEMVAGLPDTVDELLTPRGFAVLRRPTGTFARALRVDAEVCTAWSPDIPIRLYKISDDEQATTANTDHCQAAFRARGVNVPVVDVGDHTYNGSRHLAANLTGTALIVHWFGELAA
jgi:hypothetical protein